MDSSDSDPITGYSKTERVVLLIDLHPLLHLPDPTLYTAALLSSAAAILSFPPLSSSLFSFRLFFSSLSPLLSSSALHSHTNSLSLSFDHPSPTLRLLSRTLSSLPSFLHRHPSNSTPKASHFATTLRQLIHDYAWDPDPSSNSALPSNLVLLFSPFCNSLKSLSGFFDADNVGGESLQDVGSFCERFSGAFGSVRDVFVSRDIHCSWVNVRVRSESECAEIRGLFDSGVKALGWGFCGADSIVLGSALVPFGLIYPKIGVYWDSLDVSDCSSRKFKVQLNLQILDDNGNPIQYYCGDLELTDLKIMRMYGAARFNPDLEDFQGGGVGRKERFWKQFLDGITKFEVKAVKRCDDFVNFRDCLSESVVVHEVFTAKKKNKGGPNEFFADRVLEMLATEFGSRWRRKSAPIWEILLSFLCREGCWALVSLTNANGGSCTGVLRPFTVSSALLSLLGGQDMATDLGGANLAQYIRTVDSVICKSDRKSKKNKGILDSQAEKSAAANEGQQKKRRMDLNTLQNLTWSSFCDSVYDQFETDLQEVYSAMGCNKSKELKFLKWWTKQMKKSGCSDLTLSGKPKSNEITAEENKGKLTELPQDGEQPISSPASARTNTEASRVQDDGVLDYRLETSEAFFSNLSNKIQQGIESEVIDLGALAERLVNSSIYWLCQKEDREINSEGQKDDGETNSGGHKACGSKVASELIKLLLRGPNKFVPKHKTRNSFSQASEPGATTQVAEHAVREYELQILFRMEILQSEVGIGVEDSSKQKFVKQICQLLENIQCHMEAGFFGDWSLENYVAKIIKSRYSHTLEDVVHKIYNKIDLQPFADEDEAPNDLLNSEDSNKSFNRKVYRDEMGENDISIETVSAESEPFQLENNDSRKHQSAFNQEDHERKLIEAKERRERARRFTSFTSWIPDLQRVWVPKQKGMKPKTDPFGKLPKRKERKRASYDKVCETPLTGNKRSSQRRRGSDDDSYMVDGSQTSGSVSKALFRDD